MALRTINLAHGRAAFEMIAALEAGPKTFANLWAVANASMGFHPEDSTAPGYRLADRFLQKERRAGNVAFVREGRACLWSLTEIGRARALPTDGGDQ